MSFGPNLRRQGAPCPGPLPSPGAHNQRPCQSHGGRGRCCRPNSVPLPVLSRRGGGGVMYHEALWWLSSHTDVLLMQCPWPLSLIWRRRLFHEPQNSGIRRGWPLCYGCVMPHVLCAVHYTHVWPAPGRVSIASLGGRPWTVSGRAVGVRGRARRVVWVRGGQVWCPSFRPETRLMRGGALEGEFPTHVPSGPAVIVHDAGGPEIEPWLGQQAVPLLLVMLRAGGVGGGAETGPGVSLRGLSSRKTVLQDGPLDRQ